jgi:hypothetical protein
MELMQQPSRQISAEADLPGHASAATSATEILAATAMLTDPMRHSLSRISAEANLTIPAQAAHEIRGASIKLRISECGLRN